MPAAHVREACGIPGTSRAHGVPVPRQAGDEGGAARGRRPVRAVDRRADTADEVRAFARAVGFPLILKPRDGAGASGTFRVDDDAELERALARARARRTAARSPSRSSSRATRASTTRSRSTGRSSHEFALHYYPNVLEAMRTRWISPQFVAPTAIDSADGYDEVKAMGAKVAAAPRHRAPRRRTWSGSSGPRASSSPRSAAARRACARGTSTASRNDMDLYREWAMAVVAGPRRASGRRAASPPGIIALRPDRDGAIAGYEGVDEIGAALRRRTSSTRTSRRRARRRSRVEAGYMANAWLRVKHPDYDALRRHARRRRATVKVRAH